MMMISHGDKEGLLFGGADGEYIRANNTDIWDPIVNDADMDVVSVKFVACTRSTEAGHGLDLMKFLPNLDTPMANHNAPWGVDLSDEEALDQLNDALAVDREYDAPRRELIESHKAMLDAGEADGVMGQSLLNNQPHMAYGYWYSDYPVLEHRATEEFMLDMRRQVERAREDHLNAQE